MAYRRTPAVQERLDAARERLLSAALGLVAERGYAGCAVAEVAARAGVGTGTVYRYFPNKGELFAEVFRTACSREVAAVRTAAGDAADCACQRVTAAIGTFATRALAAPRLAYALLVEPVDPLVDAERLVFRESYRDLLAAVLTQGVDQGQLPDQDTTVTAAALIGAAAEALVLPLTRGTADAGTLTQLISFTLRSLGGSHDDHARSHQPGTADGRVRRR